MAAKQFRQIVTYGHGARFVSFENVGLARAVAAVEAEDPPGEVGPDLDAPPGRYIVRSRSAQLAGRTEFWYVALDPVRGTVASGHNCPARAENARANIQCRHIALAWLCWKQQHDAHDPFLRRVLAAQQEHPMSESTALAVREESRALRPYVPTPADVANNLALATTLMETRGAAIPYTLDTPAKVAAVIMAGQELGFEPMMALKNLYIVNGITQPNAQAIAGLIQKAGGDIVYEEMTDERCTSTLIRPGRQPLTVTYTIEQARKSGLTKPQKRKGKDGQTYEAEGPWQLFPADMLVWKAVTRLGRRGAADIINGIESAMVQLPDVEDYSAERRPVLTHYEGGDDADVIEGDEACPSAPEAESASASADTLSETTISAPKTGPAANATAGVTSPSNTPSSEPAVVETASTPSNTSTSDWRNLTYAEAHADKATHFRELSAFQKEMGRRLKPDGFEDLTLGEICDQATARTD